MNIKSILLGASAAALAATGAQAADLPVAPEPVDYVRVCDAFGTGFFYIPGTETCLKIGGGVRVEFRFNDVLEDGGSAWDARTDESTRIRARGYLNFDSRTNTEYGLLRTYVAAWSTTDNAGGSDFYLDEAFVQLGGFVAGRTATYFQFYTGNNWGAVLDQGFADYGETNLFAYTAQFGNGFSASASVEVANKRGQILYNGLQLATPAAATALQANIDGYGGHKIPDFVANLRVDQGWGSAQIMGALHHVYGRSLAPTTLAGGAAIGVGVPGKGKLGWAIGAGATFNLPMIAPGDNISLQATYSQGAIGYVNSAWDGVGGFADASYNAGNNLKLSSAWGIGGGFTHFWTPAISSALTVSYTSLDQAAGGADVRDLNVQGNLIWRPVSGLYVGAELEYLNRNTNVVGGDSDTLVGIIRVQRTF